MFSHARFLVLSALVLTGCGTAKKAAITSFRVLDAPARYVRDRIDPPETTTTTTTTESSDVVIPGRPVAAPTPPPTRAARTTLTPRSRNPAAGSSTAQDQPAPNVAARPRTTPSGTPRPSAPAATEFPTARPVPGRAGYVYSIDPNGGIVDITGYKSGDKAKDPYTKQIFIVP